MRHIFKYVLYPTSLTFIVSTLFMWNINAHHAIDMLPVFKITLSMAIISTILLMHVVFGSQTQAQTHQRIKAVLEGKMLARFVDIGTVEFQLTDREKAEYLAALLMYEKGGILNSEMDYASPELENLFCGNATDRYTVISPE